MSADARRQGMRLKRFMAAAALALAPVVPAQAEAPAFAVALGHNSSGSQELFLSRRSVPFAQGLQPVFGASLSTYREAWAGAGLAYTWRGSDQASFVRAALMPGLYSRGNGRDLGGPIMFRSSIEAGWNLRGGGELSIGLAHRSNAGIYAQNPGLDTLFLSYSRPLR